MLKKRLGIILGILVLILGAVCWMKLRTPEEGQKVDNYRVIFEKGSYCGGTRTGCMDLKISLENGEHRKMFASADDVTGNGYHTITDDHYLLRVCLDDQELNSTAYEISADLDPQLLRIYFTNPQAVASQDPVEIKISKGTIDQEVARIPAELTNDSSLAEFTSVSGNELARICASGIYLDLPVSASSAAPSRSIGSVRLQAGENTYILPFASQAASSPSPEESNVQSLLPAVASTNQELPDVRIYATEIPDWEAVDSLTLTSGAAGSLILVRKDQMEDLTYVSGAVQSQEADTLFVAGSDGCFYKAPVPEDLQDTSFTLGQSVDIFYQEKTPQPYGYDLRGVTAISTFIL